MRYVAGRKIEAIKLDGGLAVFVGKMSEAFVQRPNAEGPC